jgi:hypothetical protein
MRPKRRMITLVLLILLTVPAVVFEANGQTTDRDKLGEFIQRNEELLQQAETLVRGTSSAKARVSLDAARQLHLASIKEFQGDRLTTSAQMAGRARNAILKAIQLAKRETKMEERALKAIEYAGRRNEYARNLFDEAGAQDNVPARKLIDESMNQLIRARRSMREHMFEVTVQSATASIDMSNRAIRLLKRDSVGPELVRREIARTDVLLDRIDERADRVDNPQLIRLIADAHELQARARANASEGRYILAFEETKRARTVARRIINRAGGSAEATVEAVARALELTDGLIERAYGLARENGNDVAVGKLDEAYRLQQNAHDAFEGGQYKPAHTLTRRAREIARNAIKSMNRTIDADSARRALERTDEIIARLRAALDSGAGETAAEIHDRAANRQTTAWNAFESGDLKKALANTKVARNLANRALRQLENG